MPTNALGIQPYSPMDMPDLGGAAIKGLQAGEQIRGQRIANEANALKLDSMKRSNTPEMQELARYEGPSKVLFHLYEQALSQGGKQSADEYIRPFYERVRDDFNETMARIGSQHRAEPVYNHALMAKDITDMEKMLGKGSMQGDAKTPYSAIPTSDSYWKFHRGTGAMERMKDESGNPLKPVPADPDLAYRKKEAETRAKEQTELDVKKKETVPSVYAAMKMHEFDRNNLLKTIDKAIGRISSLSAGIMAVPMSEIAGTDAAILGGLLTTIKGNMGMEQLQTLRQGGASLGQVTEGEHKLLQSMNEFLDNKVLSPEQLKENLMSVAERLRHQADLSRDAFIMEYSNAAKERGIDLSRFKSSGGRSGGGKGNSGKPTIAPEGVRAWDKGVLKESDGRGGWNPVKE